MKVDHYMAVLHSDSLWINPVNYDEMIQIHNGNDILLEVCQTTCLCYGGNDEKPEGCLTWDEFINSGYQDMILRIAV